MPLNRDSQPGVVVPLRGELPNKEDRLDYLIGKFAALDSEVRRQGEEQKRQGTMLAIIAKNMGPGEEPKPVASASAQLTTAIIAATAAITGATALAWKIAQALGIMP